MANLCFKLSFFCLLSLALSFFIVLSAVELTKAQSSARNVLENYQQNPTAVSRSDVEKAYNTICCGSNTDGIFL